MKPAASTRSPVRWQVGDTGLVPLQPRHNRARPTLSGASLQRVDGGGQGAERRVEESEVVSSSVCGVALLTTDAHPPLEPCVVGYCPRRGG